MINYLYYFRYFSNIHMMDTEFDSQQIERAFPKYKYEKSLGKGAFGKVFLVQDRQTQQQMAVKKISCFGMCEYERNSAINEVRILASLDHPNIIKFISGMFDSNEDDLYIFMEYALQGDLFSLIQQAKDKKKRISQSMIWNIIFNMADGIDYLHKNQIIHRDIKPANIFRSKDQFKLADMNVSKILANGDLAKTKAGSPLYTCPQVWNREEGYNQKCDIWSLGVVAYQLCCLKVPFQANSIDELIKKQKTVKLKNIPNGYSGILNQTIHEMLQYNSKKRISAQKLKNLCLKFFKLQAQFPVAIDPLIGTIVIPESEQRWVNLVPIPPKSKKQPRQSREKVNDILNNKSNLFINSMQNKSIFVPKHKNNVQKGSRLRLPSIQRKNSTQDSLIKINDKSKQKSRQKSRQNTRCQTPERKQIQSSRVARKS